MPWKCYRADIHYQLVLVLVRNEGRNGFTIPALREKLEISNSTIFHWMTYLKELELVYVSGWKKMGKIWTAEYSWGYRLPDVPRPKRLTSTEYSRLSRIKAKLKPLKENVECQLMTTN